MTEAARIYHQDVAEKSRQKNSAYHKKGGSAVTKLGNKQDRLVDILEKHGPCVTYPSTDNLMEYSDFVRLPNDLKIEFVNKICDKYDVDIKHISRYLFNKGDDGLRAYLRNNKILQQCNPQKKRGKTSLLRFEADVAEWKRRDAIAKEIDSQEAKAKQEALPPLMSYNEFKKLKMNDQVSYINSLIETYQVSSRCISLNLFGRSENWIANHFGRFGRNEEITKLSHKLIRNTEWKFEHERNFKKLVEAWKDFSEDPTDISPVEEPMPVKEEKMIEKAPEVPETKKLPPDEEFELEETPVADVSDGVVEQLNTLATNKTFDPFVEEEKEEPEVDPFAYHEMHFSTNYIHMGLNMEEIYMISELFKNKKVKVLLEVTEV